MNPTMTRSMTAPIVALTIDPRKPANGTKPSCLSSQTPMNAPMMPMMMFQIRPKPESAHDLPGQPAGDRADDQHDDDAFDHDFLCLAGTADLPP